MAHRKDDRGHWQSPGYDKVKIRYCAVPNTNTAQGGWAPSVTVNGRQGGNWASRGLDKDVALRRAAREAQDQADHYSGDWNVTVRRGRVTKSGNCR